MVNDGQIGQEQFWRRFSNITFMIYIYLGK